MQLTHNNAMMKFDTVLEEIKNLPEQKQEEIFDFVEFLKTQEKKAILLAQFNTSFAKGWLNDPIEDIYDESDL